MSSIIYLYTLLGTDINNNGVRHILYLISYILIFKLIYTSKN